MKDRENHQNNGREDKDRPEGDLGQQIWDLIQDSVDSMDFSGLSRGIQDAVDYAREETSRQIQNAREKSRMKQEQAGRRRRFSERTRTRYGAQDSSERFQPPEVAAGKFRKLPGAYSGPIQTGLGGVGLAVFGALSLGFGISGIGLAAIGGVVSAATVIVESVFIPLTILSGFFLGKGVFDSRRVRRLKGYVRAWEGRSFIMLEDLSAKCGLPVKKIHKDIQYILERHLLPEARMDAEGTCLMLTKEAGKQYDAAMQAKIEREKKEAEEKEILESQSMESEEKRALYQMQKTAEEMMKQLSERKGQLSSPNILEKINRLELLLNRIFVCVKDHPETISQTDRLMEYYLPSVMKLLRVYDDLEEQPIQGENIIKTKKEIEDSLDMINQALETMYDELFQDVAMDVSSDIKVLETMLARDGWTDRPMHSSKEEKDFF